MRHINASIVAIAGIVFLCSCGGSGIDINNSHSTSDQNIPPNHWDPGNNPAQNGYGYGYGYGNSYGYEDSGNQNNENNVNCQTETCAHGHCLAPDSTVTQCICDRGYEGRLCTSCITGYTEQGGLCIPDDPCIQAHCVYGKCIINDGVAECKCHSGYAGPHCDECDEGFHVDTNRMECVAD